MGIDPVKIPQNVYVEDRIIGPVSLRQLIIVLLSSGLSYAIWSWLKSSGIPMGMTATVLAWTPAGIGAAFAFIKIQGISLFRLCFLMAEKLDKPAIRTFAPRRGIAINIRLTTGEKEKTTFNAKTNPLHRVEELSQLLDRGPDEMQQLAAEENLEKELPQSASVEPQDTEPPAELKPVDPSRISVAPLSGGHVDGVQGPITRHPHRPGFTDFLTSSLPPADHV